MVNTDIERTVVDKVVNSINNNRGIVIMEFVGGIVLLLFAILSNSLLGSVICGVGGYMAISFGYFLTERTDHLELKLLIASDLFKEDKIREAFKRL